MAAAFPPPSDLVAAYFTHFLAFQTLTKLLGALGGLRRLQMCRVPALASSPFILLVCNSLSDTFMPAAIIRFQLNKEALVSYLRVCADHP